MKIIRVLAAVWLAVFACGRGLLAQDMPLSMLLIEGEEWQVVAEGLSSSDAPCADDQGNFYFTEPSRGRGIKKVDPQGNISTIIDGAQGISGLKFGPDGRLYACQGASRRILAYEVASGRIAIIADNVEPNDLVVTHKGDIYFTETGKKQVTYVSAKGELRAADVGINKPNGITLSPDQGTLFVSDYGGTNIWAFRIEADGRLSAKAPYMTMRAPVDRQESAFGDGMATDSVGRYYVASAVGVQIFDPTGRMCGVLPKPQNRGLSSVMLAGPKLEYLYITCSDKVYRRKTKATGVLFFQSPAAPGRQ